MGEKLIAPLMPRTASVELKRRLKPLLWLAAGVMDKRPGFNTPVAQTEKMLAE